MDRPVDPDLPEYEPGEPRYGSLDEVVFEIHAEHGPAVLREALGMLEIGREDLEDCAVRSRRQTQHRQHCPRDRRPGTIGHRH
jgi:hypothetical protein